MRRRQFFRNLVGGSVAAAFAPRIPFAVPVAAPVSFSAFLTQTSFYDQMAAGSMLYGRAMAEVLNEAVRKSVGWDTVGGAQIRPEPSMPPLPMETI